MTEIRTVPAHLRRLAMFSWNEDCTEIIGLTSVGRATIEALHLNRIGVMNLRRVLFEKGLHPPA